MTDVITEYPSKMDLDPVSSPEQDERSAKRARIRPHLDLSSNIEGFINEHRCGVWGYEYKDGTYGRPARSPKNIGRVIPWGKEKFEKFKYLWGSYSEAMEALEENAEDLDGIVLLIEPDCVFDDGTDRAVGDRNRIPVYLDFDDCRDPETGEITEWVREQLDKLDTYAEVSPSGTGIRVFAWGSRAPDAYTHVPHEQDDRRFEIYGGGIGEKQLITVTGRTLEGFDRPMRDIQLWIDEMVPSKPSLQQETSLEPQPLNRTDDAIFKTMLSGNDGKLMQRFVDGDESLWEGEDSRYDSRHEADLALFNKLSFYTGGDEEQMRRIARSTRMNRQKWDREDYLSSTVQKAINGCNGTFYDANFASGSLKIAERDVPRADVDLDDDEIIDRVRESKEGKLWEGGDSLWTGDDAPYRSLEAAQLGLCAILSFYCGNDERRVERVFRRSGLYRDNWEDSDYRSRSLRKALSEKIYDPAWRPSFPERDGILKTLEEARLNLAWGCNVGLQASCVYDALIWQAYRNGMKLGDLNKRNTKLNCPISIELFIRIGDDGDQAGFESGIVVLASDRGLMLGSGITSKDAISKGIKLLQREGLIRILRRKPRTEYSIYLLETPYTISDKIIPYPPGFIGTHEECCRVARELDRRDKSDWSYWKHPYERVGYRETMKRVPKKPFRSPLNSKAVRDDNVKDLIKSRISDPDHPDIEGVQHYKRDGEVVALGVPHPVRAFSAPFTAPVYHIDSFYPPIPVAILSDETLRQLRHMKTLTPRQKFTIEQVAHGRLSLLELIKFFGEKRKDNFKSRVLQPLCDLGLLMKFEDMNFGSCYKVPDNLGEIVDSLYCESGSDSFYEKMKAKVAKDRDVYGEYVKKTQDKAKETKEKSHESISPTEYLQKLRDDRAKDTNVTLSKSTP